MTFFYSTVDSANSGLRLVYRLEIECRIVGMPLLVGTETWVLSPLGIVVPTYVVSIARALSTPTLLLGNLTSSQWQSWCYKPR